MQINLRSRVMFSQEEVMFLNVIFKFNKYFNCKIKTILLEYECIYFIIEALLSFWHNILYAVQASYGCPGWWEEQRLYLNFMYKLQTLWFYNSF